jgi:predicted GNAT family N-acyltransferase
MLTQRGSAIASDERITIVRTLDDFMRAAAVRSVVYIADQQCPYEEEFDGNDFCGMHFLGWAGAEPAACLRIRFFREFVKLERLAVRPEFRRSSLAFRIVRFGLQLAIRKGYRTAYGHAQEGLEPFWARFGARPFGPAASFSFSGYRYTEMVVDLPASEDAILLGADPMVTIRPEGDWDRPGVLERVSHRVSKAGAALGGSKPARPSTPDDVLIWLRREFAILQVRQLIQGGLRKPSAAQSARAVA